MSIRSGQFSVVVTMDEEPSGLLAVEFRTALLTAGGSPCASMDGIRMGVQRPLGVVLNAPLFLLGNCGDTFDIQQVQLLLSVNGRIVLLETVTLERPVRFEP